LKEFAAIASHHGFNRLRIGIVGNHFYIPVREGRQKSTVA
jgi:hypothetical protein